jgi:hypothetical protein
LPPGPHLDHEKLLATVQNKEQPPMERFKAATKLAWLERCRRNESIDLGCLTLGDAKILHMPGELFIEHQLEAQHLRPDGFVAMAAYGDYGTAYIGTAIAYTQGGYETGPDASFVAPEVEGVLVRGMAQLLKADPERVRPLR